MATTMRSVDTRFWIDGWVRKLNALDRYVFLYFLTNPHSSWCGVYEVDLGMVSYETGIEETELTKVILPRLEPKVRYLDGWVYIPNFERYHANHSEKTQKGIENAWKTVPERIRLRIRDSYPTEGVSAFASASSSALLGDSTNRKVNSKDMGWKPHNENDHTDDIPAIDVDSGEKIRDRVDEEKEENKKITHNLGILGEARGKRFLDIPTQRNFYKRLLTAGLTHKDIGKQFMDLVDSDYWVEKKKEGQLPDLKSLYSITKNKT